MILKRIIHVYDWIMFNLDLVKGGESCWNELCFKNLLLTSNLRNLNWSTC